MIARAEEKPLGGKNYSTLRKSSLIVAVLRCPVRRKGAKAVRGGCQRGAGIITSSGIRGGEDVKTKATRTLWRLLSDITTAMPSNRSLKNARKNEGSSVRVRTSVNYRRHRLSTTNYTLWPDRRRLACKLTLAPDSCRPGATPAIPALLRTRPIDYPQQRSDGTPRCSFGTIRLRLVAPGSARDIKVRPGHTIGKLFDERRRGNRARLAPAHVLDVGNVRLDLFRILLVERQLPELLADFPARRDDLFDQLLIRSQHSRVHITQRNRNRARQRGHVDNCGGAEFLGVGDRVRQNQPSFSVGVDDLDRFAGHRLYDVTGFGRLARRQVFSTRSDAQDRNRRFELRDRAHRAHHCRGSRHVVFHQLHVLAGLQRNAARVERHAFSDKRQQFFVIDVGISRRVLQHDQFCRLV